MVFTSTLFLFLFVPTFLFLYYIVRVNFRNSVILVFSLLFYGWGEPRLIYFILLSALIDWIASQITGIVKNKALRVGSTAFAILVNVGLLFYFKYANFFIDNVNYVKGIFGSQAFDPISVILPLGISFIVFEKITYVADVYRGVTQPAKSLFSYLLYVFFFPKIMAGPIIKYHDICKQFEFRQETWEDLHEGFLRFARGMAKKVLLANALGLAADKIFDHLPTDLTAAQAWFGALAFGFELYFDFSGYSDMAIGLARMVGLRVMENFNSPYHAESFTEFWKRWHISLTQWIREYLYIPLGGNRLGTWRTYLNLWICFLISGLWHGANWTFVFWGMYHGTMLILERLGGLKLKQRLPYAANVALTFILVTLGWVLFRANSLGGAFSYLGAMFSWGRPSHFVFDFDPHLEFVFIVSVIVCFIGLLRLQVPVIKQTICNPYFQTITYSILLYLATGEMFSCQIKTFIYFRF